MIYVHSWNNKNNNILHSGFKIQIYTLKNIYENQNYLIISILFVFLFQRYTFFSEDLMFATTFNAKIFILD